MIEGRFSSREASLYAASNDSVHLAEKIVALTDDHAECKRVACFGRARGMTELNWQHQIEPLLAAYMQALAI